MRHQKMISLDEESLKIASTLTNFSGWVRAQLLKYDEELNPKQRFSYHCKKCDRVFTYARDQGDYSICRDRSQLCRKYGHTIGRLKNAN